MRRPAAAPDRASPSMKEAQLHSTFLRGVVQIPVCFKQFPCAGQHSSIFIGIGVAEHDLLPSSPGIE